MRKWLTLVALVLVALAAFVPKLVAQTHIGVDTDTAQTLSNKTLDATNTYLGRVVNFQMPAASTSGSLWDLPTSNPAEATAVIGTNVVKGVLDYAAASDLSAQNWFQLPLTDANGGAFNTSGTITGEIVWFSSTTSGNVVWQLSTSCTATGASAVDDASFNTATSVTSAVPGTANRLQTASVSSLGYTGCTAGSIMHVKLRRAAGSGSDTMAGTARLLMVRVRIPRI